MLPAIAQKKVFVFDWDGTLFNSMAAKTASFTSVVGEWLARKGSSMPAPDVARLYRLYSGAPRCSIFRKIARDAGLHAGDADCEDMSGALFTQNRIALKDAVLFEDALPCLDNLLMRNKTICLSSSVPQAELSHFVARKLPVPMRRRMAVALGCQPALSKGSSHIDAIGAVTGATAPDMVMIGDDMADRDLSTEAGIDSLLVDRDRHLPPGTPHISSLAEIAGLL